MLHTEDRGEHHTRSREESGMLPRVLKRGGGREGCTTAPARDSALDTISPTPRHQNMTKKKVPACLLARDSLLQTGAWQLGLRNERCFTLFTYCLRARGRRRGSRACSTRLGCGPRSRSSSCSAAAAAATSASAAAAATAAVVAVVANMPGGGKGGVNGIQAPLVVEQTAYNMMPEVPLCPECPET